MEWNLDLKSFKRIYDYEQRKGSNIDKLFHDQTIDSFMHILSSESGLWNNNSDNRKKHFVAFLENIPRIDGDATWIENIENLISISNFSKKEIRKIRKILLRWKESYIESLMENFSETKELEITKGNIINGKQVYCIKDNARDFIVSRILQQKIKQVYRLESTNRNIISAQLRNILEDRYPKIVIKADVESFYESIDFKKAIDEMEADHLMSSQFIAILRNINYQYRKLSGNEKGIPRGIGVSAFVAEYIMRNFDKKVRSLNGLYFYARFVDDVIAVFSAGNINEKDIEQNGINKIQEMKGAIPKDEFNFHTDEDDPKRIRCRIFSTQIECIEHKVYEKLIKNKRSLDYKISAISKITTDFEEHISKIQTEICNIKTDLIQLAASEYSSLAHEAQKMLPKAEILFNSSKELCNSLTAIDIPTEQYLSNQLNSFQSKTKAFTELLESNVLNNSRLEIPYSYAQVEFLGYKYIYTVVKDSKVPHLVIDIADSKIERQKRKIDTAFKHYFKSNEKEKLSFRKKSRTLFYRIKFLTDTYYLVGYKRNIIAGLSHSYPLVSDECQGFKTLNQYLHNIVSKNCIPEKLKEELKKLKFKKWNKDSVPVRVNKESFSEIMKCWREK